MVLPAANPAVAASWTGRRGHEQQGRRAPRRTASRIRDSQLAHGVKWRRGQRRRRRQKQRPCRSARRALPSSHQRTCVAVTKPPSYSTSSLTFLLRPAISPSASPAESTTYSPIHLGNNHHFTLNDSMSDVTCHSCRKLGHAHQLRDHISSPKHNYDLASLGSRLIAPK